MPISHPPIAALVKYLNLEEHPEGGFFAESYRADLVIPQHALTGEGDSFPGDRNASTAIYYLLPQGSVSRLHRIKSDEIFHLYPQSTCTATLLEIDTITKKLTKTSLGSDIGKGQVVQRVVRKGLWFGVYPDAANADDYAFFGCTVAPGFAFEDFEVVGREMLEQFVGVFPENETDIRRLG
ncbi:hypothetical protein HK104_009010 [Borealophlyctis nickersoniae]|nr:hypothetical protein HK104_009010 [Borealophlyctis nickersoniae]